MSNAITSGIVDAPINSDVVTESGTAEKEAPDVSVGAGDADSQHQTGEPGDPKPSGVDNSSEDGPSSTQTRRPRSQLATISELRAERRELRQTVAELRSLIENQQSGRGASPSSGQSLDDAAFWNSPLGALRTELANLKKEFIQEIQSARERDANESRAQQESSEAVKFIRAQKGITPDDEAELIEIIEEKGLKALPPMARAELAFAYLQQQRGVANRTPQKQRASSVVGMPGAGGKKIWTRAEYDGLLDRAMKDPKILTMELEQELREAAEEGRIK